MRPAPALGRLPLLAGGMLALLGGALAGLARVGWSVPAIASAQAGNHAALMISAFFGTVISLERAVALGRRWAYVAPAAAAAGGLVLLAGGPLTAAQCLMALASGILVMASGIVLRRLLAPFTLVLAFGALCWLAGNLIWQIGDDALAALPWWFAFLVLTIAGERLELTRFLPARPHAQALFYVAATPLPLGAAIAFALPDAGLRLFAGGLLALALWLARYDIARHNAGQRGLTRYVALCLLCGYFWLAMAGVLGLSGALLPAHPWRDAALHAVGLGFVFAMVFGHAPIIFPAVARIRIPYHPGFYVPLAVLNAALLCRVGGSFADSIALRRHGALATALALALFVATLALTVWRDRRPPRALP